VTVLCPVVVAEPTWLVAGEGTHFAKRRSVRSEAIGDDGFRNEALVLEQFPQQFQRCLLVPAFLDENIQDLAFLVDRAPHVHSLAANPHHHLIQMPHTIGTMASLANVGRDGRPELVRPAANGFVGHIDPAFGEQVFDVSSTTLAERD